KSPISARTALGLGDIATQNAGAINISGGIITGISPLAISDGGTGSNSAVGARSSLGLDDLAIQSSGSISLSGGNIDGTIIGSTVAAAGSFTTINAGTFTGDGSALTNIKLTRIISVGTGGNFASITLALASIVDNSSSSKYLIKVAPGTYNEVFAMKSYVDIEGSGIGISTINLPGTAPIIGVDNSEIRFLSIDNSNASGISFQCNGSSPSLYKVSLKASSSGIALDSNAGNPKISNSTVDGSLYSFSAITSGGIQVTLNEVSGGINESGAIVSCIHSYDSSHNPLNDNCSGIVPTQEQLINLAPPSISASSDGTVGRAVLSWAAVPNASSYTIFYDLNPGFSLRTATKVSGVTATSYNVDGLTSGATYRFVAVSNVGLYASNNSSEITYPDAIVVFHADSSLGSVGVPAMQTQCSNKKTALGINLGDVRPFLSYSTLAIKDIPVPSGVTVKGSNGNQIKVNYAQIWIDGTIDTSLGNASSFPNNNWWTGSTPSGTIVGNCTNWTGTGSGESGWWGTADNTFIDRTAGESSCANSFTLACIAWGVK
ncbi:hypothetical protein MJH12_11240, partial [bacterium]|nr:hypothetical protein [bacterium]